MPGTAVENGSISTGSNAGSRVLEYNSKAGDAS